MPTENISKTSRMRDRSRRTSASLRKQRQRQRQRKDGMVRLEITVSKETAEALSQAGEIAGSSIKAQAEYLIRATAARSLQDIQTIAKQAGEIWILAAPLLPYSTFLSSPGAAFTIKGIKYTHADWAPLQAQLAQQYGVLQRRGWSRQRIDQFFARAARSLSKASPTP